MATFTTNYNLRKPADADFIENDTDINANMDIIDTEIKALDTRVDALEVVNRGIVIKSADESVTSSATMQNDDHLSLAVTAGKTYKLHMVLFHSSAADNAGDIKIGFTFPAGTLHVGAQGLVTTVSAASFGDIQAIARIGETSSPSTATPYALNNTITTTIVEVVFVCTGTGTLQLQWAQNASSASASTMKAGSHFTWESY